MNEQGKWDVSALYVEDDSATRDEVTPFLEQRVREVLTAENGRDGLALYRQKQPDLVITDIRMPAMDGLQMAREVRDAYKGALIIVTTAHSDASSLLDAIDIGIDQYVVKPLNMKKFAAAIEKCVEIIEYRRAHKRYLAEREKLVADLQQALAEIKTLHGILPICSHCKKIRDEDGAWHQLEAYISNHSDTLFSHGLCEDCAKTLYSEYYNKARDKNK